MKSIKAILAVVSLAFTTSTFAADCSAIFTSLNAWVAADNHLVRIVTTLSSPDNVVTYTRGYLSPDDNDSGSWTAESVRYTNATAAADGSPFSATTMDRVKLTLIPAGSGQPQLNYIAETPGGSSVGYSMTCLDNNMMYIISSTGLLTLSLRFDAP